MRELVETLDKNSDELKKLIAECGDDQVRLPAGRAASLASSPRDAPSRHIRSQQKKLMSLIPKIQGLLAPALQEYGFPPAGPGAPPAQRARLRAGPDHRAHATGMMQAMVAFTAAAALEGGECIAKGRDMLTKAMSGTFPTADETKQIMDQLS